MLDPVLPYISKLLSAPEAQSLLEHYFQPCSQVSRHPCSSHLISSVLRRSGFLTALNTRASSPALLAAMLWMAAESPDCRLSRRVAVCKGLSSLTIDLLNPLDSQTENQSGIGFKSEHLLYADKTVESLARITDEVLAQIHVAMILLATCNASSTLRWWNVTFARLIENGFHMELDPSRVTDLECGPHDSKKFHEMCEERRRVWWFAYAMDKHLALCYNTQVMLRESDCSALRRPVNEDQWQLTDVVTTNSRTGAWTQMMEPTFFGLWIPVMTLLGRIIEIRTAEQSLQLWSPVEPNLSGIRVAAKSHIEEFVTSAQKMQDCILPAATTFAGSPSLPRADSRQLLTLCMIRYALYMARVLGVLVCGAWDAIEMLEDGHGWVATDAFRASAKMAAAAAEQLPALLELDPDFSLLGSLFSVYLIHGSQILLVMLERLDTAAAEELIDACTITTRAATALSAATNTDILTSLRKALHSALAAARGRARFRETDEEERRRTMLRAYRWTPGGRGLAG